MSGPKRPGRPGAPFGAICRFCGSAFGFQHPSEAECIRRLRSQIDHLPPVGLRAAPEREAEATQQDRPDLNDRLGHGVSRSDLS